MTSYRSLSNKYLSSFGCTFLQVSVHRFKAYISFVCVSVWGCAIGRTETIGADSGEPRRGLIATPMSVLEIRCQKFPGGLQTPAPNLPSSPFSFSHPSTPLPPLFFLFSFQLRAALRPFWLWFLAPHYWSAHPSEHPRVCVCVFAMRKVRFPYSNTRWARHARSLRQTDRWVNTHRYVLVW